MGERETTVVKRQVGDIVFTTELPFKLGPDGSQAISTENGARFDTAIIRWICDNGAATPETFKYLRRTMPLKATELAELLGVAPETVSRWETGKQEPERAVWAALFGLAIDVLEGRSTTRDNLRAMMAKPKLAKTVRLAVSRRATAAG